MASLSYGVLVFEVQAHANGYGVILERVTAFDVPANGALCLKSDLAVNGLCRVNEDAALTRALHPVVLKVAHAVAVNLNRDGVIRQSEQRNNNNVDGYAALVPPLGPFAVA